MMRNNGNDSMGIVIIAIAVGVILILYLLSKMFFVIGIALTIISIGLIIFGWFYQEDDKVKMGFIGLFFGIGFIYIGVAGITFFEENPTGINLLDMSNTVVNVTTDSVETYGEISSLKNEIQADVLREII